MIAKLEALIMALTLFFVGLFYGDEPVKVEFTAVTSETMISAGDSFDIDYTCINKGKPFKGFCKDAPIINFINSETNEKAKYSFDGISSDCAGHYFLVKTDDAFCGGSLKITFPEDITPGTYDITLSMYDCTQVFEDAITIK